VQYIPHILITLGYVVSLLELANESRRCPVVQTQLLHPNPWDASEEGTALVKATEHKCMKERDISMKSQGTVNDPQLSPAMSISFGNWGSRTLDSVHVVSLKEIIPIANRTSSLDKTIFDAVTNLQGVVYKRLRHELGPVHYS